TKTETTTMNLPSGKLMALIAVFAAIGVITGTGAFTTVTAERTATVGVSGDSAALLGITGLSSEATQNSNGVLQLNLPDNINPNAATEWDRVFKITNNGQNAVTINITVEDDSDLNNDQDRSEAVEFAINANNVSDGTKNVGDAADAISDDYKTGKQISVTENTVRLASGQSIYVGMYIDTSDGDPANGLNTNSATYVGKDEDVMDSIRITAESNIQGDFKGNSSVSQPS
ncbi:MAG: hypothetical protein ABEI76_08820, partial [Halobacteriales archaeon]